MRKNTQSVLMAVTPEQSKIVAGELEKFGYIKSNTYRGFFNYIAFCNGGFSESNYSSLMHNLPTYNLELFMALASMSEGEELYDGELLRSKHWVGIFLKYSSDMIADENFKSLYQKATKEEIIKYHSKQEPMKEVKAPETRKIIGYICPMDLYGGGIKKGTIITIIDNKYCSFRGHMGVGTINFPSEIVETWQPVYEQSESEIKHAEIVELINSWEKLTGDDFKW